MTHDTAQALPPHPIQHSESGDTALAERLNLIRTELHQMRRDGVIKTTGQKTFEQFNRLVEQIQV